MTVIEEIALRRADEQMEDPSAWMVCKRGRTSGDPNDIRNGKPDPQIVPRSSCFALGCGRQPMILGSFAGYCELHAQRLQYGGTVESDGDYPTYREVFRCAES